MKYGRKDIAKDNHLHDIIWACGYSHTSTKDAKHYRCKPVKGMITYQHYNADTEREKCQQYSHTAHPRYFVPFRKNSNEETLDDLAWSKAVRIDARVYADTEQESIEQYNAKVVKSIKEMIAIAKDDANDILTDHLTPEQRKLIDSINAVEI